MDSEEFGTRKTTYRKICWKLCRRKEKIFSEKYYDVILIPVPLVNPEVSKSSGNFLELPLPETPAPVPENRSDFCFHLQR